MRSGPGSADLVRSAPSRCSSPASLSAWRAVVLGAAAALAACAPPPLPDAAPDYASLRGEIFGSTWALTWGPAASAPAPEVEAAVRATLDNLDARLSTWRADSEVSRLKLGPLMVAEDTAALIDLALDVSAASQGAFDPTVQPLMHLWGFRGQVPAQIPTDAEISAAKAHVGWERVRVTRDERGPTVDAGGADLDVAAIAPGWAADRVADAVAAVGATDIYVDVGGEAVLRGRAPSGNRWRIGIDTPEVGVAPGTDLTAVLAVSNAGLATSGNYRSQRTIGGVTVGHTMDPRTGRPASHEVASVTVIAPTAAEADAWATVLMVLNLDDGQALLRRRTELDALWVLREDAGYRQVLSDGMTAWLPPAQRD